MPFKVPYKRKRNESAASGQSSRSRQSSGSHTSVAQSSATRSSLPPTVQRRTPRGLQNRTTDGTTRTVPAAASELETLADAEDDADLDALNEVVMAVDLRDRGTVGCSYYLAREEKLYLMEDVRFGGVDIIDTCDQFRLPYLLEVRPSSEFQYEGAKNKLVNLRIGTESGPRVTFIVPGDAHAGEDNYGAGDRGFTGREEQLLRLSGWIDIESRLTVGCAGAVLTYLQRRRAAGYLPRDDNASAMFRVSTIEMFSLSGSMFINTDTLLSLQVMQSESHPHSHNQGPIRASSGSKEGLSVYGLFHHLARTPQGKFLLRQYFLRPTLNISVINERLNTISVFLRPDNAVPFDDLIKNLKSVKNMRMMMVNLRKGVSGGSGKSGGIARGAWSSICQFVYHALKIRDIFQEVAGAERLAIWNKILDKFEGYRFAQIGKRITEVVDFEESTQQHRTVVKTGVDEELDNMKRTYDGIDNLLSEVARHIAEGVPSDLRSDLNVIYFPQIGFLVAMMLDEETGCGVYEGGIADPWE
ncbi:hypothetical protein B0A49_08259, partial [Cryomyces minteri]